MICFVFHHFIFLFLIFLYYWLFPLFIFCYIFSVFKFLPPGKFKGIACFKNTIYRLKTSECIPPGQNFLLNSRTTTLHWYIHLGSLIYISKFTCGELHYWSCSSSLSLWSSLPKKPVFPCLPFLRPMYHQQLLRPVHV